MKTIMLPEPNETERALMERIHMLMREEEVYTNPNFTLSHIATRLKVKRAFIKDAISRCMNKTLGAYVNEYRVIHAMDVMSRPENASLTLDAIACASGFSNRYCFYSIFKEMTGLTPTEFKACIVHGSKNEVLQPGYHVDGFG
ncbi:AraC family transcriptional regulator [Bacteroides sp. 51]|uniref:helix-turn-helix domain-containing protein n=1 Tax=Bacteroides sp. 51 TaxID=2302938 RepID=UPI0013D2890A|nr:helix-turn-helix domain-containing protein [Bacteroides sp. 51]NDV81044.1 AraC family transcriptional regulator [Bacteroides sp. 51]